MYVCVCLCVEVYACVCVEVYACAGIHNMRVLGGVRMCVLVCGGVCMCVLHEWRCTYVCVCADGQIGVWQPTQSTHSLSQPTQHSEGCQNRNTECFIEFDSCT